MSRGREVGRDRGALGRRVLRALGTDLRSGEGGAAILLFLCFFLLITFQYATKSVRQSTFIDGRGAAELPWVYLSVALVSYPFLLVYSRFANRVARHRLIVGTSVLIGLSMVACWWLFQFDWSWLPYAFYVWISLAYVMNVSQFWAFSANLLDPRQAKRLYGFIGAGGLLGGIAGGQVAKLVAKVADTRSTFLVAGAIVLAAAAVTQWVHRLHPPAAEPPGAAGLGKLEKARGGFGLLRTSRHLRFIAAIVVLGTIVAQIVDFQFNWAAEQATAGLDERTAFFGNFFSIMGISAFVFQLLFTSRIHRRLGVGVALRASPVTMAIGTSLLLVAAGLGAEALLAAALVLKVGENGLRYSVDQATRELLYMPVPAQTRVRAKAFIDVFMARGAKGLGALVLLPVTFGLMGALQAGWITLGLIVVWLAVTVWAHREYIRSFRQSLRERAVDTAQPIQVNDVTTLEILIQSLGSADRRQVLHALEILADNGRASLVPPLLLYHDDAEVRRRTLEVLGQAERRDATALIERRLGDDDVEVRAEAVRVLAGLLGRDASDVMLPRLREAEAPVRAAAVAALARHGDAETTGRAEAVLAELASDADPEVRREAAKAIGATPEPRFRDQLVRLLYDADPRVAREAIAAVRRRAERDGYAPIYLPTLVSLLQQRRVKHEASEALVALGEPAVAALCHFLADPDEPLWVRRALPRTLAAAGGPVATQGLVAALGRTDDRFLRRKVVEALADLDPASLDENGRRVLRGAVLQEIRRYLRTLVALEALGLPMGAHLVGPILHWDREQAAPDLLQALLADRLAEHVANLFGLLAVFHPPRDVWAAHRSLTSGEPALISRALEYLENLLQGDLRRHVFAVVDDAPLPDRLRRARQEYGLPGGSRLDVLGGLLDPTADGDERFASIAAMYVVYSQRESALRDRVVELAEDPDPLVAETARWIDSRWQPGASHQAGGDES